MKRIGLVGGTSPESTVVYYQLINAAARRRLGGEHSANMVVHSIDYGRVHAAYAAGDWDAFGRTIGEAAAPLVAAGCEVFAIGSNTSHLGAERAQAHVGDRLIHIMDALADAIEAASVRKPLLLGTRFVMEGDFYRPTLKARRGVETLIPNAEDRDVVERIIFDELCVGVVTDEARAAYEAIVVRGAAAGADAVIFGCTEINLLMKPDRLPVPAFDTTVLHAEAIVAAAFGERGAG
ncbi:MAG: amino acid racemase [Pseudomonadota bacterium]